MEAKSFAYWLQGYFELTKTEGLDKAQVEIIRNHLNMVFKHDIDPKLGTKEHQDNLKKLHTAQEREPFDRARRLLC